MALKPENPVVGGTVLRRAAIQSPNYVPGVSGWVIKQDGSVEFNNGTFRGTLTAATFIGNDFIINTSGAFFYSGPPAAGNLIASVAPAAGADSFGNNYVIGHATYAAAFAAALNAGFIVFYTGSLAGGWIAGAEILTDSGQDLILIAAGAGTIQLDSNTVISGTLSVNGSTNTGACNNNLFGLTTSGASAGTAHTHTLPFQNPTATHTHPL